jgi:hypothetical protein
MRAGADDEGQTILITAVLDIGSALRAYIEERTDSERASDGDGAD